MNIRLQATKMIWTAYTLAMLAIFVGTTAMGQPIGAGHVIMGIAISITAFLSTGVVWNWGNVSANEAQYSEDTALGKRKNKAKLARMLERLSDEERALLYEQLEEEAQPYGISDDGELMLHER